MAATGKVLAAGKLPASKTTLFTAAARTKVVFGSFHNTQATIQTLVIYLKPANDSLIVERQTLVQNGRVYFPCDGAFFWLETGDVIEGQTTTAGAVDYFISGEVDQ
jgi:hypothetical protein